MKRKWALIGLMTLWMVLAFFLGARHDYLPYQDQWKILSEGLNPYFVEGQWTTNAYGPIHNFLYPLYEIHPLLPKLFFVASWLVGVWFVFRALRYETLSRSWFAFLVFYFFLNPYLFVGIASWGHQDAFLAALVFFSIQTVFRHPIVSGLFLGVATAYKFFPAVLTGFLGRSPLRGFNGIQLASFLLTVLISFGLGYWIWGDSIFYPFTFAETRPPKEFSIFLLLSEGRLGWSMPQSWISPLSKVLILISGLIPFFLYQMKRTPLLPALVAGILGLFTFYPVGHMQFHYGIFLLLPLLWLKKGRLDQSQIWTSLPYILVFIFAQLSKVVFGQYSEESRAFIHWMPLPYLLSSVILYIFLLKRTDQSSEEALFSFV